MIRKKISIFISKKPFISKNWKFKTKFYDFSERDLIKKKKHAEIRMDFDTPSIFKCQNLIKIGWNSHEINIFTQRN